jgi:predicted dehydrogenase
MTRQARIAVIGAGWWSGRVHLPALAANPDAELAAVCDADLPRARQAAAMFGAATAVGSVSELLDLDLDGAIVATPHDAHYAPARALLQHGIDTMIEKPMALDPREAWDLVTTARASGARLHVGYPYMYSPHVALARQTIRGGELGPVVMASSLFASGVQQFFAGQLEGQRASGPFVSRASTYSSRVSGGGQLMTQVTHATAVTLWCTGLMPVEVSAYAADLGLDVDVVDVLNIKAASGALIGISSTGTVYDGELRAEEYGFYCADGHVRLDTAVSSLSIARRGAGVEQLPDISYEQSDPVEATSAALVAVALGRGPVIVPGEIGALTVSVLAAAAQSARTGAPAAIWVPDLAGPEAI